MQSIDISGFKSGVQRNKKPFLLIDDAFTDLQNAYIFREELKKREGLQFIGRLRRVLISKVGTPISYIAGVNVNGINVFSNLGLLANEPNAEVEISPSGNPFTITIGTNTLTDLSGTGVLTVTGVGPIIAGYINYKNGVVIFSASAPSGGAVAVTISMGYFPSLPVMGITTREVAGINDEDYLWFDTIYCYRHNGSDFEEFLPADGVTWDGTNSDFFWTTNYRGSESQNRLYFETNFVLSAGSPMRYTDGTNWTDFQPIIGGQQQTQELTTTLAAGSAVFGPSALTDLPILKGSVVITVTSNDESGEDIIFRDTPKDGTLVSSGSNTGTINYATGDITLNFNPVLPGSGTWTVTAVYSQAGTFLFTARVLIPYYGRLIALNTYEGTEINTAVNIFNRCRFSQIGNPVQQDAWRSDVFGKGGFVDAPTNEEIISATFYKNTLIVFFERSTWRLQYIGEYGLPFIWERISSDFGSESTFSAVLFDSGVLAVGDKAIVGSNGNDVQRIDLDIPDQVYRFKNSNNGPKRVYGVRDFKRELVFWCYPDYPDFQIPETQFYPNKTLVYNYRNNTYAFFRNNVTCFGPFTYPVGISWDSLDVFWDNYNVLWDNPEQPNLPLIASGNQQGFAHFYGYPDVETGADSTISAIDQESLSVSNVTVGATTTLTIIDHNLSNGEFIYLVGMLFVVPSPTAPGSTTLNDQVYMISIEDKDTITLFLWDIDSQEFYSNFPVINIGNYVGGGLIALFPQMYIETKDFNPVKPKAGYNLKTSYIDFLFDVSSPSPLNVKMIMNTNLNTSGNILDRNVETANGMTGIITNVVQTVSPTVVITSKNHSLLEGYSIEIQNVGGSIELNGNEYEITFIDVNTFSISEASLSAYTTGGFWTQNKNTYFGLSSQYTWHRFLASCFGQYLRLVLTYDNNQMMQLSTHQQNFVLNAMQIYYRLGGKNIFGK